MCSMNFMDSTIEKVLPIWNDCINTAFVQELKDGTLPMEKFKQYIIQDSIYLKHYARVFGKALYHSTTMAEIQLYYSILSFVNTTETATRSQYMKKFGITDGDIELIEPLKENKEYYQFMLDVAEGGDNREILMAVLPCMISYNYIFKELAKDPITKNSRYWDFMADYIGERYSKTCEIWAEYGEKVCKNATDAEKEKFLEIFTKSSLLEVEFWNMSYR